nr:MAG TPA: hypothetical protein [Caudoviricetes sp.]
MQSRNAIKNIINKKSPLLTRQGAIFLCKTDRII